MQFITNLLTKIDELVWGLPLICLLLGTGIYFTCKLKLLQLTKLKLAFSCIFKNRIMMKVMYQVFRLFVQHYLLRSGQEILLE